MIQQQRLGRLCSYPGIFEPLVAPIRYKGAFGGRSSGKSHFFATLLVMECMNTKGTRAVCIREIQRSLEQSSKILIQDKIRKLGVEHRFDIRDAYIGTPGGGVIIFQGMQNHTADSLKSLEGFRIAWVDEAHRLSAFSLGLLRPTIRVPGSQLWFSWNPFSPEDPVDLLFRRNSKRIPSVELADAICVEANYDDNPFIPPEAEAEAKLELARDPSQYRHVWLGEYQKRSEARVFNNVRLEDFDMPATAPVFYYGADWGFAKDPTVLVRCFIDGRRLFVDRELWQVGLDIDRTPSYFDGLDPGEPRVARKWSIVADSSNPQAISYMRRNGYPKMRPAIKGKNSVEEGVEFLRAHDIIVHPRCKHVWDELMNYSYKVDPKTEEVLPKLEDAKNHTIDALRYAVEGIRRRPNPPRWGSY